MREAAYRKLAILSLNTGEGINFEKDYLSLKNIHGNPIKIMNDDHEEIGHVINVDNNDLNEVIEIAKVFKQSKIVLSKEDRSSYLLSVEDNSEKFIGYLKPVCESEARKNSNYLFDFESQKYFVYA